MPGAEPGELGAASPHRRRRRERRSNGSCGELHGHANPISSHGRKEEFGIKALRLTLVSDRRRLKLFGCSGLSPVAGGSIIRARALQSVRWLGTRGFGCVRVVGALRSYFLISGLGC